MNNVLFAGAKIHDNIALSLLKWLKENAANRDVIKIVSKEILLLEVSDNNAVRQTSQEYVEELLQMPMDLKTEKNLKLFNEKMKGNCPADIQFSSVAPAVNDIDGEIELDEMENETQSDNSLIGNEDVEASSDVSANECEKSIANEQLAEDAQSESNQSGVEQPAPVVEKTGRGRKRVTRTDESITEEASTPQGEPEKSPPAAPVEPYNTTSEVYEWQREIS